MLKITIRDAIRLQRKTRLSGEKPGGAILILFKFGATCGTISIHFNILQVAPFEPAKHQPGEWFESTQ